MDTGNQLHRSLKLLLATLIILSLQACSIGGKVLDEVNTANDLSEGEVILVGTIALTPELNEEEQTLSAPGIIDLGGFKETNQGRVMIYLSDNPQEPGYATVINPLLGDTFYFKVPANLNHMVKGEVITGISTHGITGKIHLPVAFQFTITPKDKAIYIGRLEYTRDDFNSITKLKFVDEYKQANKAFQKKFGKSLSLKKSLLKKM